MVCKKNEVSDFEENLKTPRSIFLNLFWLNSLYKSDEKKHQPFAEANTRIILINTIRLYLPGTLGDSEKNKQVSAWCNYNFEKKKCWNHMHVIILT